jgi:hypothetical protein
MTHWLAFVGILASMVCSLPDAFGESISPQALRPGDVLLQPLNCWACSLIEEEEETRFSHIGVVIATTPEVRVAEAYGKVRAVSLSSFDSKTERGQTILVLRFRNLALQKRLLDESSRFKALYQSDFDGAEYDSAFRWNNFDASGRERLYCSELVTKLFQAFAGVEIGVKRMHFIKNREAWERFFKGQVPDGLPGNSPGDFHRSEWFYEVGELAP